MNWKTLFNVNIILIYYFFYLKQSQTKPLDSHRLLVGNRWYKQNRFKDIEVIIKSIHHFLHDVFRPASLENPAV